MADQNNQGLSTNREIAQAVALQYQEADSLPRVIAKGSGELAAQILKLANEYNVPIREDKILADMLSKITIGYSISEETFKLVAEIICFLYHSDKCWAEKHQGLKDIIDE